MRCHRSVPWAGAVVAVLLAALLHVLACSHGPTAAPDRWADALSKASAKSCGQQLLKRHRETRSGTDTPWVGTPGEIALTKNAPAPDHGVHDCSLDVPAVQPSRDLDAAGRPLPATLPAEHAAPDHALPPPTPDRSHPRSTESSAGHTRARLGVWRT